MPNITFIHPDGSRQVVVADAGSTVMQVATAEGLEEILAECGGNCMCATCHVYVAADQLAALPALTPSRTPCWTAPRRSAGRTAG